MCANTTMRDNLNAAVPIVISHNSDSGDSKPAIMEEDADVGLAMRILHSFFTKAADSGASEDINQFYRRFAGHPRITAKHAIRCCLHALGVEHLSKPRTGVLLLVDAEVVSAYDAGTGTPLGEVVGQLLDEFQSGKLNVMVTTLDTTDADTYALYIGPNRAVIYAPLPPFTQKAGEAMLLAAWHKQLVDAGTTMLPTDLPHYVRVAISEACGHPGTLQWVKDAWLGGLAGKADEANRTAAAVYEAQRVWAALRADTGIVEAAGSKTTAAAPDATPDATAAVQVAADAEAAAMEAAKSQAAVAYWAAVEASMEAQKAALEVLRSIVSMRGKGVGLEHVKTALAGKALSLNGRVRGEHGRSALLRKCISAGTFINALPNKRMAAIPRCTWYQLLGFAAKHPDDPLASLLTEMANCGLDVALRGVGFERFILARMRLVMALRGGASTLSVTRLWRCGRDLAADSLLKAQLRLPSTVEKVAHAVELGKVAELEVDTVNTFDPSNPGNCCNFAYVLYTPYGYFEKMVKAAIAAKEALKAAKKAAKVATAAAAEAAAADVRRMAAIEEEARAETKAARKAVRSTAAGVQVAVVCVAVRASEPCTPPATFMFKKGEHVPGTESVAEVARELKLLKDRKQAIKAAVVKKSGGQLVEADVGVLYTYVMPNRALYGRAGAEWLTRESTPDELAEYMRAPKEGEKMVRLFDEDVAVFQAVLCKHENMLVVDGKRFAAALSPSLADWGTFVLQQATQAVDTLPPA